MTVLRQTHGWKKAPASFAKLDALPERTPVVGDLISYACGSDGFDPIHHTTALQRLREGRPVFYATYEDEGGE